VNLFIGDMMVARKGINLRSYEKWSEKWAGFIEQPNGRLRKPYAWTQKNGIVKTSNMYFFVGKCIVCGKESLKDSSNAKNYKNSVCSRECHNLRLMKPDGNKIFKRATKDSHVMVKASNHPNANKAGYVAEHRLLIENKIGRYLDKNEHVHHINLIKNDNSLDNLVLFNNASEHFLAHGSLNKCVAKLIEKNLLTFNRETKTYEVL
jgi:hypothetical protein